VTCGVGEEWIQKFGGGRECHIELDFKETELESVDGTFQTTWGWGGPFGHDYGESNSIKCG
jgi:hypothetical protein